MPRQTHLTAEVYEKIVASVRRGNYFSVACRAAGVSESTGKQWLAIGRGSTERSGLLEETVSLFATFASDVEKAEAEFEQEQVEAIEEAARVKTKVQVKQFADGSGETTETEETNNWAARGWLLERRSRQRWGKDRLHWFEALTVLVDEGILPPSVLEVARDGIKALRRDLTVEIDLSKVRGRSDLSE